MRLNIEKEIITKKNKQINIELDNFSYLLKFNEETGIKNLAEYISSPSIKNNKNHIDVYMAQYPDNFKSNKIGYEAIVGYSSTEADDGKLLHLLYQNSK